MIGEKLEFSRVIAMPSRPLQVFLTTEQDQTLFEMRTATTVPQRTKDRAEVLRLSHRGWKITQIAEHFSWSLGAVRQAIHRWKKQGLGGLWDAPRQGRSRRWQEADLVYLEELLATDPRTYSSQQLADKLSQERHVELSHYQVQRILKKKGTAGNGQGQAIVSYKTR